MNSFCCGMTIDSMPYRKISQAALIERSVVIRLKRVRIHSNAENYTGLRQWTFLYSLMHRK